jgi:uncharacterized protein
MKKLFLFLLLSLFSCVSFCVEIPKPQGYVSDYENLFSSEQKEELTNFLLDYEKNTTVEIAILTVPEYGDDIFDFAQETATSWGIGKDSTDNGLLIVICKNKKEWRIQTGYGLEGYLPDGWLKNIGDKSAEEYFKKDKYYDGTIFILNECKTRIEKEGGYTTDNNKILFDKHQKQSKNIIVIIIIIILIIILLCIIFPDTFGILVISLIFGGDSDSGGGFGGGGFGGGGAGGGW